MSDKALMILPRSMTEVESLADTLSKSTLLPDGLRGKAPDIVVSILAGQELGIPPMAAIRGVHVVQGKPILSADMMVAIALGSGLAEYFSCVEETDTKVTYETKRRGDPAPQRFTWSDEDTKAAGLNTKDNWRLHKRQMRRARCKAVLARDVYPDVLAGCYEPGEEVATAPSAPHVYVAGVSYSTSTSAPVANDVEDAVVVDAPAELADLEAATTRDQVKALAGKLSELAEPWKTQARARYGERLKELAA